MWKLYTRVTGTNEAGELAPRKMLNIFIILNINKSSSSVSSTHLELLLGLTSIF